MAKRPSSNLSLNSNKRVPSLISSILIILFKHFGIDSNLNSNPRRNPIDIVLISFVKRLPSVKSNDFDLIYVLSNSINLRFMRDYLSIRDDFRFWVNWWFQ